MSDEKHIKNFTAADIEKYHKGLLSSKEMHELEKAAMEDPFLADALEGFAVAGVNLEADMDDLRQRLAQKSSEARVIPMGAAPKNSFRMLRAAVVVAFIATAGLLIYKFGFDKKEDSIAKNEVKQTAPSGIHDSVAKVPTASAPVSNSTETKPVTDGLADKEAKKLVSPKTTDADTKTGEGAGTGKLPVTESNETRSVISSDDVTVKQAPETKSSVVTTPPPAPPKFENIKPQEKINIQKEGARDEVADNKKLKTSDKGVITGREEAENTGRRNVGAVPTVTSMPGGNNREQNQSLNIFRGQVTDAENRGVPFANVTNVQDNNAGTYTDARGYFNLTYPDTVLNVQVRSVGFENNNVQLRNSVPSNQVVLQNDRSNLQEVVVSRQRNQAENLAARKKDNNMQLDEPEPADGWDNYGTYLSNNLDLPVQFKDKPSGNGEVIVSFEVDKNGNPVNLKVEKSLCAACDKEALRVVKEGPKWKRAGKKTRTKVTVSF